MSAKSDRIINGASQPSVRPKRTKNTIPAAPALPEMSGQDRELLTDAYKAGLIVGWRHDTERGCRLTLGGGRDEYVELTKLPGYLQGLRNAAS
jgi:hypothetical protein